MVSFSGSELTYNQVVEVLDILDYNYFFRSIDLAAGVNYPDLLLLYNEVLKRIQRARICRRNGQAFQRSIGS